MADEDYTDAVLDLVETIPPGRAMTYGLIAEVLAERLGRGGPRQVGRALSHSGGSVPWWRVTNAAGCPPAPYASEAIAKWHDEGTPLTADGSRVALRRAVWWPEE